MTYRFQVCARPPELRGPGQPAPVRQLDRCSAATLWKLDTFYWLEQHPQINQLIRATFSKF